MVMNKNDIQAILGYNFDNESYLVQAFIRRSYSEENGGENNEVLEFIGDKALDLVVIRIMMEKFGNLNKTVESIANKPSTPKYFSTKYNEGKFTDLKKEIVKKKALAKTMDNLGLHHYLIMGKGDILENVQNQDSVKEDLFEAIIGAITLDCDWNLDVLTDVISSLIDFDSFFENEDEDEDNYISLLQEWYQKKGIGLPLYTYEKSSDGFLCTLDIDKINYRFKNVGASHSKARKNVAKDAYLFLKENGYLINPLIEAIGKINVTEPIKQINELVQKKLLTCPDFEYTQSFDEKGISMWTCEFTVDQSEKIYTSTASSKKEAQKDCILNLLNDIMNNL